MFALRHLSAVCAGLAAGFLLTLGAAHAQDAAAGKKVFAKCGVCHNADKPANKVGPSLQGVFGRTSGTLEGFKYSDAMKNAAIVWSPETLDQYLTNPKAMVPGTKMAFAGLPKPEDRANVIVYLEEVTKTQ